MKMAMIIKLYEIGQIIKEIEHAKTARYSGETRQDKEGGSEYKK